MAGLLLAAGAGRRYGMPKALAEGGGWLRRSVTALLDGGCDPVLVVLGAAADRARPLVPEPARVVIAPGWDEGMGASLRAGLAAVTDLAASGAPAEETGDAGKGPSTAPEAARVPVTAAGPAPEAVLVHLVDLPDVGAAVVRRVVAHATPAAVVRAAFDGRPGHPVLLGRDHWEAVAARAAGDRGARAWLAGRLDLVLVECSDLATGADVDRGGDGDR